MSNPIKSHKEIELEKTLDMIDFLLNTVQREADNLPDRWQDKHCDDFPDEINELKRIAKEATELW